MTTGDLFLIPASSTRRIRRALIGLVAAQGTLRYLMQLGLRRFVPTAAAVGEALVLSSGDPSSLSMGRVEQAARVS
jgi:hypothetical protein